MSETFWNQLRSGGEERFSGFAHLMPFRVQEILLVASLYDAFNLEEGGRLTELLLLEYRELNLSFAPRITNVTSGREALDLMASRRFDLVLTMSRVGEFEAGDLAGRLKDARPDLPVYALALNPRELLQIAAQAGAARLDRVFMWTGDVRLLLAMIKSCEDQRNLSHDTRYGDVRLILLVEDSVRFASLYLPLLYTELVRQTQAVMDDGINLSHRLLRMRARPKILLATTFEEAWGYFQRYQGYLLGVISDGRFPRGDELSDTAGLDFLAQVKQLDRHLPVVLQSTNEGLRDAAHAIEAGFIHKDSRHLLAELRAFMADHFGFGDFVFRLPDGLEIARAHDLRELVQQLAVVPEESVVHHAAHDHFSTWLRARTEFALAAMIRPRKVGEFAGPGELRRFLHDTLDRFCAESQRGVVADFSRRRFDDRSDFVRIGSGSLGGKGRGLAFMNAILNRQDMTDRFPGTVVRVPPTAVVATDVFEEMLATNRLRERVSADLEDGEIAREFLARDLPRGVCGDLAAFLREVRYPIAVRSSSLLEDSQFQPFAGVYATYMLPNNHPDPEVRLANLVDAVKLVYASAFNRGAKAYLAATGSRVEEERMAAVIQQVVGRRHEDVFYPDFAGVAHSTNFYPAAGMDPGEGVVCAALGLGRTVVEGGNILRFNPRQPARLPQFGTIEDWLRSSQRTFEAIDLSRSGAVPGEGEDFDLAMLDLAAAERHGTLDAIGSVYSEAEQRITDGIGRPGVRLVSFAHVLKADVFPLAEIMTTLLELARACMSVPVEIEWAAALSPDPEREPHQFGFLQIRPLALAGGGVQLERAALTDDRALVATEVALGNGRHHDVHDIVYVRPDRFDRARTREIAQEVAAVNRRLLEEGRPYILLGPGRWGTSDHWLGVPVRWDQISGARVIVETDLPDFRVTPSEGSHFFHNLTSFHVGYLTVNHGAPPARCDWAWLDAQPVAWEGTFLRQVRLETPLEVVIDGRNRRAVVLRPA
jgi:CheY-like chemotaxis protein